MKRTLNEVRFVLKDPGADSSTLIYLVYRFGGQRLKYSTGEKVDPDQWDQESQRIKVFNKDRSGKQLVKDANTQLDRYAAKVIELRRSFDLSGLELNPELFKLQLDKEFKKDSRKPKAESPKETLFQFIQRFIDEAKAGTRLIRRKNKRYSLETLKTHQTTLTNLEEYKLYSSSSIDFDSIDLGFHSDFISWLTNEKEYAINSIGNQIKHLKTWLRASHKERLHDNRIFEDDEFNKPVEESDSVYLTDGDLTEIYNLDLTKNKKLDNVRDMFLLGCYTGLRFSDFSQLRRENIINDGKLLMVTTQKGTQKVFVPINARVSAILNKHKEDPIRTISNQKTNDYIKDVVKDAGITYKVEITITKAGMRVSKFTEKYKEISTHTARRSFATNAYLAGVPSIDIMKITGHKTETNFMKYIKVTGEETAIRMLDHKHFKESSITIAS